MKSIKTQSYQILAILVVLLVARLVAKSLNRAKGKLREEVFEARFKEYVANNIIELHRDPVADAELAERYAAYMRSGRS